MKIKQLLSLAFVAVPLMASAQDIEINEENFPDENFRNYLREQSYGKDGIITENEIKGITAIDVYNKSISNLRGIEYFTALTDLVCSWNLLSSLDLSNNTALTYLSCSSNQLTSLDLSYNTALNNLSCEYNLLTSLNVSNNTALTDLSCSSNKLTSLDVSNNTALTKLYCSSNQLTNLDLSTNTALTNLECYNNLLTFLDLSNHTSLVNLEFVYNQLISLNLSGCTALTTLNCRSCPLTSLNVSGCTALKTLYCQSTQLTSLNVSACTALAVLWCYNNQIRGISMDAFINSLPKASTNSNGYIYIYNEYYNDNNICTRSQADAIKAKGWGLGGYDGCDDPTTDIVSVGTDGLATYCPAFDMDFSEAKEMAAYKATISGNDVLLERVYSVAAGEGVLLRSLNGEKTTEELPIKATEKNDDNAFVGVLEAKTLQETEGNVTNFVLSKVNGEVGFFKANDTMISAWKAYLPVEGYTAEMAAKGLSLVFDDATGISDVTTQPSAEDDAIYTLSGVRVANPTKGIYIKNGKKMVVK